MRYKTLAEFAAARQVRETNAVLNIDNDSVGAYEDDGEGEKVFEMHPDDLLVEALGMLGIPSEHV